LFFKLLFLNRAVTICRGVYKEHENGNTSEKCLSLLYSKPPIREYEQCR
jgi:hypothetical protein